MVAIEVPAPKYVVGRPRLYRRLMCFDETVQGMGGVRVVAIIVNAEECHLAISRIHLDGDDASGARDG